MIKNFKNFLCHAAKPIYRSILTHFNKNHADGFVVMKLSLL